MNLSTIPVASPKMLRQFGLVLGFLLIALFGVLFPFLTEKSTPVWPWVAALALWIASVFRPLWLTPMYRAWMAMAHVLNWIMTRLLLGLVFYVVIWPLGCIMKITGKDPMARKWDKTLASYRVTSAPSNKEDMERPF